MTTKGELLKAVKLQCQECMGSTVARNGEYDQTAGNLVEGCTAPECRLFPFRVGKDPWKKRRVGSDNIKKAQAANAARRDKG